MVLCTDRSAVQTALRFILPRVEVRKDVAPRNDRTDRELELIPYLGGAFQLRPSLPEDAFVGRIYYLCPGVTSSSGFRLGPSVTRIVAEEVCGDISRHIFLDQKDEVKAAADAFDLWEE